MPVSSVTFFGQNVLMFRLTFFSELWPRPPGRVLGYPDHWRPSLPTLRPRGPLSSVALLLFSHSVTSDFLRPHGLQHTWLSCPLLSSGIFSNSCPLSQWCHPTISSSVIPLSSCLQSFPASGSFPVSQLFTSGGWSIRVSASASVLPMNIQRWCPLGHQGLISLLSKRFSRVFSSTTVWKHQFERSAFFMVHSLLLGLNKIQISADKNHLVPCPYWPGSPPGPPACLLLGRRELSGPTRETPLQSPVAAGIGKETSEAFAYEVSLCAYTTHRETLACILRINVIPNFVTQSLTDMEIQRIHLFR